MIMINDIKEDYLALTRKQPTAGRLFLRFFSDVGFRAVCLYRVGYVLRNRGNTILAAIIQRLILHWCQCTISLTAKIGPRFAIHHVGAIVIGGATVIGENCQIRQGVTFGGNIGKIIDGRSQPLLGNNILVGAGAVILGPVIVGNDAIIGANAVVSKDVQAGAVVGGVPAKVIRSTFNEGSGNDQLKTDLALRLKKLEAEMILIKEELK
jgi:serine O-acetyltransferase